MDATFRIWETSRNIYSKFFDNYSLEQLNTIPAGMSNNLIWNMGHVIVSQLEIGLRFIRFANAYFGFAF